MRTLVLTCLILIVCLDNSISQTLCTLVTMSDNSHAYIDEKNNVLYKENPDPIMKEQIFPSSDGMFRIRRNGKFGFIDCKGKVIIPIELEKAEDFHDGLAEARIKGKWCYIDHEGKVAIQPLYKNIHKFCGGLAVVEKDGDYGYINTKGEMVIPARFDRVCYFRNHKAWVLSEGRWGCIDEKGNYIIEPYYIDTQDFSEGYAWVEKDHVWGLIDSTGKYVIAPDEKNPLLYAQSATFKNFGKFNNGLLISQAYDKYGYCNTALKKVIPSVYERAYDFENGMAKVRQDDLWGMIGVDGKFIVQPLYKDIKYAGNNIFAAKAKDGLWGFIDSQGTWLIPPQYKWVYDFEQIKN